MICDDAKNPESFRDFLSLYSSQAKYIGNKIYFYDDIDSTNNEAKRKSNCCDGTVFVAAKQTAGRGRRGNTWVSDDKGIWMSILLKPKIKSELAQCITLVAGLSVSEAIDGSMIKWPNDIVIGNKKLGGILTELISLGGSEFAVVTGIGVNVNTTSFHESISKIATSVYLHTGIKSSRKVLFKDICSNFEKNYSILLKSGFAGIRDKYKSRCITIGRDVILKGVEGDSFAFAEDIDKNGGLIVRNNKGVFTVNSGEVSVRGLFGYV